MFFANYFVAICHFAGNRFLIYGNLTCLLINNTVNQKDWIIAKSIGVNGA
jgi:hypothetical protein